jgi:hypothetical protein
VAEDVDWAFNVRFTVTVRVTPPLVTVMFAVWFPVVRFAVFTLAVIVPLLDPEVGLMVSQEAVLLAVHEPVEVTVTGWLTGLAAPCVAVNVRLLGVRVSGAAVTVNVTGTLTELAPDELIVTRPV